MKRVASDPTGVWTEPLFSTWARRLISFPLYISLWLISVAGAPLWLLLALLLDSTAGKKGTWPATRAFGFFTLYLCCEIAGGAIALVIGLVTLGGRIGGRNRFIAANAALQRWWTSMLFRGGRWMFSIKVQVEGAESARHGPFLLFVRHSSTADTILASVLVANPNRLLLRYVIKRELLWDPCLDIVGRRLPNAFINRQAPRKEGEIAAILQLAQGLDRSSAVLIYPEGTRFSKAKLVKSIAALKERGRTDLAEIAAGFHHVLPPRLAGPLALIDAAPGVDILLLEHVGFEGTMRFREFLAGGLVGRTIRVRLRRIPAEDFPTQDRDRWLFELWAGIDQWIAAKMRG